MAISASGVSWTLKFRNSYRSEKCLMQNRLLFLRVALIVIGLAALGYYPLSIVWPSGWTWGHGHFTLSADDYRLARDARRISPHRIARPLREQEPYLVHRVVERGSRRDHGRTGLQ